jgi:hypothetical protein
MLCIGVGFIYPHRRKRKGKLKVGKLREQKDKERK